MYSRVWFAYMTTSVLTPQMCVCQINQLLDKSGRIVNSLEMGIPNRVLDKCMRFLDKPVHVGQIRDERIVCMCFAVHTRLYIRCTSSSFICCPSIYAILYRE